MTQVTQARTTDEGAGGGFDLSTAESARAAIQQFQADYARVRSEIAKVVVGHQDIIEGVLTCLFANGHVLLEGVPGLGKTLLVRTLAGALHLTFSRIQFTPDLMPADVTGTTIVREIQGEGGAPSRREFVFEPGPIFGQILLADEINRATPKTQSALLEAMQERAVTVGAHTRPLPRPFLVMATQNPLEQEGTYPLPEAQLDRFFFKLLVTYSGREEMSEILRRTTGTGAPVPAPVLDAARILDYQRLVQQCEITPAVMDYAVRVVMATQPGGAPASRGSPAAARDVSGRYSTPMVDRYVRVGASPRAAQALVLGAKCGALVDGRAAVAIEDIQRIAHAALRHRLILNFEAGAEGISADSIVDNVLATLPRAHSA